jgi:hypothetical protein
MHKSLIPYVIDVKVLKDFREYDKASDHAPISLPLSIPNEEM